MKNFISLFALVLSFNSFSQEQIELDGLYVVGCSSLTVQSLATFHVSVRYNSVAEQPLTNNSKVEKLDQFEGFAMMELSKNAKAQKDDTNNLKLVIRTDSADWVESITKKCTKKWSRVLKLRRKVKGLAVQVNSDDKAYAQFFNYYGNIRIYKPVWIE